MVVPRRFLEAYLASALAATTAASDEIVLLDSASRSRERSRAGLRIRMMTNKATTSRLVSPRLQ